MIPKINARGHSFKGIMTYLIHDKDKAKTSERVAWVKTGNMLTSDPMKAAKVMAWTDKNAGYLKLKSGVSNAGRPPEAGAALHYSLAWAIGENPSKDHQLEQVLATLKCQKLEGHEYVVVAHNDTTHVHVHVVVNLTCPETGKRNSMSFGKRALQKWALGYEREHGIHCHARVANAQKYKTTGKSTKYRDEKQYYSTKVTRAFELSDDGKSFVAALKLEGLHLAPGKHDKKFVIVGQKTGDVQALTRNLHPVDKYGKPITHRAKGKLIRERLKDVERSELPDADALSKQIREALQKAKEADLQGSFERVVKPEEKPAQPKLQEEFKVGAEKQEKQDSAPEQDDNKDKSAFEDNYVYDRDAEETARQIALMDAAHEQAEKIIEREPAQKELDKRAGAKEEKHVQGSRVEQQLQDRPSTKDPPQSSEWSVPSFASTYRNNDGALFKTSCLKERIAEKRQYWQIPKLEREKKQADERLKAHAGWFSKNVQRGSYARAQHETWAKGKNLAHARGCFEGDIKAMCKNAGVDRDFTNAQLEKYGFKPDVEQKRDVGGVVAVKANGVVNDNRREAGGLSRVFANVYGQDDDVFRLDISSEAGREIWEAHKTREAERVREKEGLER